MNDVRDEQPNSLDLIFRTAREDGQVRGRRAHAIAQELIEAIRKTDSSNSLWEV